MQITSQSPPVQLTTGRRLAQQGLRDMDSDNVASVQDQCSIGISATRSIVQQADVAEEVAVAAATYDAYSRVQNAYSAVSALHAGLSTIAQGIQGPVGAVLAQVAQQAMFDRDVASATDQCHIGLAFAHAEKAHGTPRERLIAETSLKAYQSVEECRSAVATLSSAFNILSGTLPDELGGRLAKLGAESMYHREVVSVQDQCRIGLVYTRTVRDNPDNEDQRIQAQAALDAYGEVTDAYSGADVLGNFLRSQSR